MTHRSKILATVFVLCVLTLVVRHHLTRRESLSVIAERVDTALLNGDGHAIFPYLWEEEVRANKLTPDKVTRILREIVLPRWDVARLKATKPVIEITPFQANRHRMLTTARGNRTEWGFQIHKVGDSGRFSLTGFIVKSHRADLDADEEAATRLWPSVVAKNLRQTMPDLQRLGFSTCVYQDYGTGAQKRKPLPESVRMYQRIGERLAAGLPAIP
jgi:hypothetical protein